MSNQPEHEPRVITEAELLYLSLDLWPGPYGGIPAEVPRDEES